MNTQFMRRRTGDASFAVCHAGDTADLAERKAHESWGIGSLPILQMLIDAVAPCPWSVTAGSTLHVDGLSRGGPRRALYSPEERVRRDRSPWTLVQGVLAPVQFVVFAVSLVLVARYLVTGSGYQIATVSILVKTIALYAIMITGSIWEKDVFDKWLFARAFFWEDVFSILVLALQTTYLFALLTGWGSPRQQMMIAIAAYAAYLINATQFLLKLRAARLESRKHPTAPVGATGGAL
jgi:3-vinyl bacteriochlorophyllide hydratase